MLKLELVVFSFFLIKEKLHHIYFCQYWMWNIFSLQCWFLLKLHQILVKGIMSLSRLQAVKDAVSFFEQEGGGKKMRMH